MSVHVKSNPGRISLIVLLVAAMLVAPGAQQPAGAAPLQEGPGRNIRADFDGGNVEDLGIGVPQEAIGGVEGAGAVHVVYGGAGFRGRSQLLHQDVAGVSSATEPDDGFGSAVAIGDFDCDGFDDVAVAAPGESVGARQGAGALHTFYGTSFPEGGGAVVIEGTQIFTRANIGGGAVPGYNEHFASTLVVGDLDGNRCDDLAVGVQEENGSGAVHVIYGAPLGLSRRGRASVTLTQGSPGIEDDAEPFDGFGSSLAIADFDGSGYEDLAVGVPGESLGDTVSGGGVHVLFGRRGGLLGTGSLFLSRHTPGLEGDPRDGLRFGSSLAAGDFNHDGYAELVVGVPEESVNAVAAAGVAQILPGTPDGPVTTGSQVLHQDLAGVGSTAEPFDRFGGQFAVGHFDKDSFIDLAVGVGSEDVGMIADAGAVNVLYGSGIGLSGQRSRLLHQDVTGVAGAAERADGFGASLVVSDGYGDGYNDLLVGVPAEDVGPVVDAGAVNVFLNLWPTPDTFGNGGILHQDVAGVGSSAEHSDNFGGALAGSSMRGYPLSIP